TVTLNCSRNFPWRRRSGRDRCPSRNRSGCLPAGSRAKDPGRFDAGSNGWPARLPAGKVGPAQSEVGVAAPAVKPQAGPVEQTALPAKTEILRHDVLHHLPKECPDPTARDQPHHLETRLLREMPQAEFREAVKVMRLLVP